MPERDSYCSSCRSLLHGEILEIRTEVRVLRICSNCAKMGYKNLLARENRMPDENKLLKHFKKFLLKKKLLAES